MSNIVYEKLIVRLWLMIFSSKEDLILLWKMDRIFSDQLDLVENGF